jgi:glycosyltransferase involved in cell wall biosynthesis
MNFMPELPELPPIAGEPISVVLVAVNEEAHLEQVVASWIKFLDGLEREYSLLLVDDGSTDRTAELAESLAKQHPRLQVLRHESRRGFGAALRAALAAAKHPLFFYTACHPRYQTEDLKCLLDAIDPVDLVSGCRQGSVAPGWLRLLGVLYRWLIWLLFGVYEEPLTTWPGWRGYWIYRLVRLLFGVRIVDASSEFKLFRRAMFARIPLQSDGPFVHVEILAKANFLGKLMAEEPISNQPGPAGATDAHPLIDRQVLAEARRVFRNPDFGPVKLPEAERNPSQAVTES